QSESVCLALTWRYGYCPQCRGLGGNVNAACSLARTTLNIMGTNAVQNVRVAIYGKGKTVTLADTGFPDVAAFGITLAFHLLCAQRGMAQIAQQKMQRPVSTVLEALWHPFVVARKLFSRAESHQWARVLSAWVNSSTVSNGPSVRPAFRSSNASCII